MNNKYSFNRAMLEMESPMSDFSRKIFTIHSQPSSAHTFHSPKLLDRFEILECIGVGGMGVVYKAKDHKLDRLSALKLLRSDLVDDPRAAECFRREAKEMGRLAHPNIVRIESFLTHDDEHHFIAMPYLPRGSLKAVLLREAPFEPASLVTTLLQVGAALAYAHSRGVIHRDIKPSNVLMDNHGVAYLSDFGLCRSLLSGLHFDLERSKVEGTLQYQSPEAVRGEPPDARGDIYSFGALLYELLCGSPPYAALSGVGLAQAIVAHPPIPVLKRNPRASRGLAKVCEGALARELHSRYAHMSYVNDDLRRVRDQLPPLGPHQRLRPSRRTPARTFVASA